MPLGAIVPVHGEAPFLGEALDSVLAQEPPPDEVVVVDDASPEPLRLAGAHADRCELVRRERRGGPGAARDTGLEALSSDLVALADADDAWRPGKLAAQLEALERHPRAAVCFGRAVVVGPDGRPTGERWEELPAGELGAASLGPLLYERNPIPASSAVIRRAALEAAGGFAAPAPAGQDWDLWLRLVERGESFVCEPRAEVLYRRHPSGMTANVAVLAESALRLHELHAGLADEPLRRDVRARDLTALARGRVRQRRYADARAALREAAALHAPAPRERALRAALAVPGLRGALGRRDPYRR